MEAYTLSALIGDVATVAGGLFDVAGETITFATSNPILLYGLIAGIVSMGIGVAVRVFGSFR